MNARIPLALLALAVVFSLLGSPFFIPTAVVKAEDPAPVPITHRHINSFDKLAAVAENAGAMGASPIVNPASPICTIPSSGPNANTDCEAVAGLHNETTIAANPTNPNNRIGGANDYQIWASAGGWVIFYAFTRAHVTFDGGKTWTMVPIDYGGYDATGDPAVAFDASGNAYMATLGATWSHGYSGVETNPDILVSRSADGGKSWSKPVRVAKGSGTVGSLGIFNDKEYIAAWGNGNAIVTWTVYNLGQGGSYINSPIYASVTHDAGRTWTAGVEISGSAQYCTGAQGGSACDQDQGSTPVMASDGSIFVSFISTYNNANGRNQYLVVKVDPQTGQRTGGQYKVAEMIDGITDYPVNLDGEFTYQDSQFRTWSAGNLAADPTNAQHLAVVWSDMRNSSLPAPADPYIAKTNSDIGVAQSFDGGVNWSAPTILALPGDQFMPWGAYDANGLLRIGFFDRSYDPANHQYGYSLATETQPGLLQFSISQLSDTLSDPTQGNRWFGQTVNSDFPHPTNFIGDYSGIAAVGSQVTALWTDLRNTVCFTVRCGAGQDAYAANSK